MKLQTDCIEILEEEYKAYVVKVVSASRAGVGDILCCINGVFYLFEIKGRNDSERALQRENINRVIQAGGRATFIRSTSELRDFIRSGSSGHIYTNLTNNKIKL